MGKTTIEWTDESVNIILARREGSAATKGGYNSGVGQYCEKVSPGCANCYSSKTQPRFGLPLFQEQRRGGTEHFVSVDRALAVLRRKKPTTFFWHDMTDMFGSWVPNEWIAACFGIMAATPQHTHQILTKRASRLPDWFAWAAADGDNPGAFSALLTCAVEASKLLYPDDVDERDGFVDDIIPQEMLMTDGSPVPWPLPNVWLGVSVEDQQRADERIPLLLQTPAAVRFISAEPLLGPVDLARWIERVDHCGSCGAESKPHDADKCPTCGDVGSTISTWGAEQAERYRDGRRYENGGPHSEDEAGLDWIIVGSESGPGARPMETDWARKIVDDCTAAGVAVFTKQIATAADRKGGKPEHWPPGFWPRQFPGFSQ